MSRLLALPLMAVVIGVLACGTSATQPPTTATQASPAVQSPTNVPPSNAATASSPTGVSTATLAAGPTHVPVSTPLSQSTVAPGLAPAPVPTVMPTAVPPKAAVIVDQPEVGTAVGKTVPHFEFTLIDGTKRSTAQLASQGKPVFLFFFATW
ncbi:MAG: hypothetical protein NZ810_00125 [Dehalococcoidia bacterium]|nr:hypothetical protein [Dehalococcoidia bacterium]